MTPRLILAVCALLVVAGDADAQVKDRCGFYEDQFDALRAQYADHPNFDVARRYRLLGEKYCNTGYASAGQKVLRHAIGLLDQQPTTPRAGDEEKREPRTFRTF